MTSEPIEYLVSIPAASADVFHRTDPERAKRVFAASDPPGRQLGSGGGTAHLLAEAWRKARARAGHRLTLESWLGRSRKLMVHGSGESRRLPAYAAMGKPLLPLPPFPGLTGQRPDQTLLDVQLQTYERLFWFAPPEHRLMITCGDVVLKFGHWLPPYPRADIIIFGIGASHEEAQRHGVMLCKDDSGALARFVQKPSIAALRELEKQYTYYLDTGVWLLNERALAVLLNRCGWRTKRQAFRNATPDTYDLFAAFGPALGSTPLEKDRDINALSCAVVPLPEARFFHFGTNASVLDSTNELLHPTSEQRSFGHSAADDREQPILLNSDVRCALPARSRQLWIENSHIPAGWQLTERHILSGIPANDWQLTVEPGICLDFAPVGAREFCVRAYGFGDPFRGPVGSQDTLWMNQPASAWFHRRHLSWADLGVSHTTDIQEAPIFPVLRESRLDSAFIAWMTSSKLQEDAGSRALWLRSPRLSARQLLSRTNIVRLAAQRARLRAGSVGHIRESEWLHVCSDLDLARTAEAYVDCGWTLPEARHTPGPATDLAHVHDSMFRYAVARLRKQGREAARFEARAFQQLHELLVRQMELAPVQPSRNVLDDQIVWGRSPIRLDLAGGWTDTPPYCLEHGGRVVNVAVDLNGQPPIQVFARLSDTPEIVVRSIDLGIEDHIRTYDELRQWGRLGSGFGIARAALALAGLEPRFHPGRAYKSLKHQLVAEFGGGIELSMVCAIPKGSGLGTSSILSATLLGTLSELCGLHWTSDDLFLRTLVLEQMLTSGGGWQDQVGGVVGGLKLIETQPGLLQKPVIRWLPGEFFSGEHANNTVLLYYTGLTRVAHDILGEIVRGMFLNSAEHLNVVEEIGFNALFAADTIQRNDWLGLCEAVRRSWQLNRRLDRGTNPPAVQAILDRIGDWLCAGKLLGAGGGGYMLMLAKDVEAGRRIRHELTAHPPNPRARFVNLGLSERGFQVTRS